MTDKSLSVDERVGARCRVCLWSGPLGFNCWLSFAQVFVVYAVESLTLFYLNSFNILMCMYKEMIHRSVRDLSCEPTIYVS